MILRDRDTGSGNERLYCMQDDNWNVVAICNTSAAVEERYTYTAYGLPTYLDASFGSRSSSSFDWTYLYTGRERDNESSLQYNRNRYYHARLGSWITRDPVGYESGDVNLYRYIHSNPMKGADPFGLKKCCVGSVTRTIHVPYDLYYSAEMNTFALYGRFTLAATFSNSGDCCCTCCSFRQGVFRQTKLWGTKNGAETILQQNQKGTIGPTGIGYVDDGYGHARPGIPQDGYGSQGCTYSMEDRPSLEEIYGLFDAVRLTDSIDFQQQIIDTCNSDMVVWSDYFGASVIVTFDASEDKFKTEILSQFD